MGFIILIILIGVAVYYISKWQTSSTGNTTSNSNPYSSNNQSRDTGPYSSQAARGQRSGSGGGSYARWIGGGLGWAFGGPIGGILGFMMGSMFQNGGVNRVFGQGVPQQTGNFNVSLVVLSAAVMKADGKVTKSELDYVKKFFVHNFGTEVAQQYVKMLGEILKQDFDVSAVAQQIGQYMDYASRLQLLHYLFGIAQADGSVSKSEVELLSRISASMRIPVADYESLKAMFVKNTDSAYTILGIKHDATEEEIKTAYREMAKKYHPDKVSHLGEDVKKAAEEKFQSVNEAYETIKKERGIR